MSGNFQNINAFLAEQGFPGVGSARYFTNAIDTRTNGVDVVGRYALDLGRAGITRFTGGYNHTRTVVKRVSATPTILASQQITLFDRLERSRIEEGQPHETLNLTLDHTLNRLFVMLHTTRYGEVGRRGETNPALDQTWPEKWISDANLSYGVTRQLRFTVGANNISTPILRRTSWRSTTPGFFRKRIRPRTIRIQRPVPVRESAVHDVRKVG